jgi:DNA-binding NarL/FixJ family response regulator
MAAGHQVTRLYTAEEVDVTQLAAYDAAVFDINFGIGRLNGLELTKKVKAINNQIKIIIWSAHDQEALVSGAYIAGCAGFVLKKYGPEVVVKYLLAAADDDKDLLADLYASHFKLEREKRRLAQEKLSERESIVLGLLRDTDDLNKIMKDSGLQERIIRLTIKSLQPMQLFTEIQAANAATVLKKI